MTMPNVSPRPAKAVALPEPRYPMVTRVISQPIFPSPKPKEEPLVWVISQPHPLDSAMRVVRMFVAASGVEVYSVSSDGGVGARNLVPMTAILLVEEGMPIDVFVDELAAAEGEGAEDDADGDENEEPEPRESAGLENTRNGQVASS